MWFIVIVASRNCSADHLSSRDTAAIMEESLNMKHFDHDNVLKLVVVCVDTGSAPYIYLSCD